MHEMSTGSGAMNKNADYDRVQRYVHSVAARRRLQMVQARERDYAFLDNERRNIEGELAWLMAVVDTQHPIPFEQDGFADLLLEYVVALADFLHNRGSDLQTVMLCEHALNACGGQHPRRGQVILLRSNAEYFLGRWDQALASIHQALTATRNVDPLTYARAILALGRFQINRGAYKKALPNLARAESLLLSLGDRENVDVARAERAAYHLNRRELDLALALYLSLGSYKTDQTHPAIERCPPEIGDVNTLLPVPGALNMPDHAILMASIIYRKQGRYALAETYFHYLIERGEHAKDEGLVIAASHHIAWLYLETGQLDLARRYCGRAAIHYKKIRDTRGQSDAWEQLGLIEFACGNKSRAINYLCRARAWRHKLGNQQGEASTLRRLVRLYLSDGKRVLALRCLWICLVIYHRIGILTWPQLVRILRETFVQLIGLRQESS